MNKKIVFIIFLLFTNLSMGEKIVSTFKQAQLNYARVKTAYLEKQELIKNELQEKGLSPDNLHILLIAYKKEKQLELWVKTIRQKKYTYFKTFAICASSGVAGPKRREGDGQVPEGFYQINRFNPASNFYLSLGIDFPNASDKILCKPNRTGGDIFIHGNCVTIGCMPLTDDKIKELYVYAIEARNNKQREIPVYIFPAKVNSANWQKLMDENKQHQTLTNFWNNLKLGYDTWEKNKVPLKIKVKEDGSYQFIAS